MVSEVGFPSVVSQTGRNPPLAAPMLILLFNESKAPSVSTCNQIQTLLGFFLFFFFVWENLWMPSVTCAQKTDSANYRIRRICYTPSLAVCTSTRRCCGTVPDEMNEQMFSDCHATNWWLGSHARFRRSCLCPPWLDVALSAVIYSLMAEPKTRTWLDCASRRLKTTSKLRRSGASASACFLASFFFFFSKINILGLANLWDHNPSVRFMPQLLEINCTGEYQNIFFMFEQLGEGL